MGTAIEQQNTRENFVFSKSFRYKLSSKVCRDVVLSRIFHKENSSLYFHPSNLTRFLFVSLSRHENVKRTIDTYTIFKRN